MITPDQIRIMYAESDPDAALMMSTLLSFSGIRTLISRTVSESLQKAEIEKFDLYLLDGGFEDGTGLELCRTLHELNPHIPIVFYSGRAYEADMRNGLEAGAKAYLVKPRIDTVAPALLRLAAEASADRTKGISSGACVSLSRQLHNVFGDLHGRSEASP